MIKLNYNATFEFTGEQAGDSAGPDITYKCWVNKTGGFIDSIIQFSESEGSDLEAAYRFVASTLISISQDGQSWPIGSVENAQALRDSVEEQNPGYGDSYIKNLAWAIYNMRKGEEDQRLKKLETPLPVSNNGASQEKSLSAA